MENQNKTPKDPSLEEQLQDAKKYIIFLEKRIAELESSKRTEALSRSLQFNRIDSINSDDIIKDAKRFEKYLLTGK